MLDNREFNSVLKMWQMVNLIRHICGEQKILFHITALVQPQIIQLVIVCDVIVIFLL